MMSKKLPLIKFKDYEKQMKQAEKEKAVFIKALYDIEPPNVNMDVLQKARLNHLVSDGLRYMYSALHFACRYNNLNLVKHFVERGWNVNSRNSKEETPLHVLLRQREIDPNIVDYLIQNGADVNATDCLSSTLLDVASSSSHVSAVRSILQHPDKDDTKHFSALFDALYAESSEILQLLLANGYNSNVSDLRTSSLFEISLTKKNPFITLLLLQDSNFATPDSVLNWFIRKKQTNNIIHPKVIELFLILGMKASSINLLSSYPRKEEVFNYNTLTSSVCTLKQLSRSAVKDMFYSKWSHLSIDEIMKNLCLPVCFCEYLRYKT